MLLDLDDLIQSVEELAPLPSSALRLSAILQRRDWQVEEMVEVVFFDEALTATLLRAANSAAVAAAVPATTAREAAVRLGAGPMLALIIGGQVREMLKAAMPFYGLEEGELWVHSVAASLAAELSATVCKVRVPLECATAALLHDIGKLVITRFVESSTSLNANPDGMEGVEAERALLGFDHGALGGMLARHWKLPEILAQAIHLHHEPSTADDVVCDVTHLANRVAHAALCSDDTAEGVTVPDLDDALIKRLEIRTERLPVLVKSVRRQLKDVLERYE